MKFINSSVEIVDQGNTILDGYKHIEKAARNCYKSEDKIDDASWERMLNILKGKHHFSPLEHFTVYLTVSRDRLDIFLRIIDHYEFNPFSKVNIFEDVAYITTNFRVIVENKWQDDLKYFTSPSEHHERRVTVKVNCSIGVSREWNRHRTMSISEQSTRYCNYTKGKFGSQITYVIPQWVYNRQKSLEDSIDPLDGSSLEYIKDLNGESLLNELSCHDRAVAAWMEHLENTEQNYSYLINEYEFKAQEARGILPLDTATCVFYTAFVSDWKKFFNLRCSEAAHPDIRVLANSLHKQFEERKLI